MGDFWQENQQDLAINWESGVREIEEFMMSPIFLFDDQLNGESIHKIKNSGKENQVQHLFFLLLKGG